MAFHCHGLPLFCLPNLLPMAPSDDLFLFSLFLRPLYFASFSYVLFSTVFSIHVYCTEYICSKKMTIMEAFGDSLYSQIPTKRGHTAIQYVRGRQTGTPQNQSFISEAKAATAPRTGCKEGKKESKMVEPMSGAAFLARIALAMVILLCCRR